MTAAPPPNDADNRAATHTLSLVVRDRPGVLVRIALVFSRRGYNIESLAVSPGAAGGFARMTITSRGNPGTLGQIIKQLAKLVDVAHVADHQEETPLDAEVALIKVGRAAELDTSLQTWGERVHIVDSNVDTLILRAQGTTQDVEAIIANIKPFGIHELVRSGSIIIDRGRSQLTHLLQGTE